MQLLELFIEIENDPNHDEDPCNDSSHGCWITYVVGVPEALGREDADLIRPVSTSHVICANRWCKREGPLVFFIGGIM